MREHFIAFHHILPYGAAFAVQVFAFALTLSVFTPSINVLLDFTTALTTPWVSHVYPAVIYWRLKTRGGINVPPQPMTIKEKLIVSYAAWQGASL